MSERKGTRGLELWCKRLVKDCPNVQIDNMTTSWRNGIAFCALVHHFRPDLIDITALKPENIYENNQLAFSIAEKELGIPALLDPIDMVENEVPDRLSILTYLSQFYRHLGHTVKNKVSENKESQQSASSTVPQNHTPIQFGKTGLDKCAACSLPVYLAQRLIVSHKLYHRRCFRCTKCSGHLNQKNFQIVDSSDFLCDSCKNENLVTKYLHNNNDQMGMLAFSDEATKPNEVDDLQTNFDHLTQKLKPQSILEKISILEQSIANNTKIEDKLNNLSLKQTANDKPKESSKKNKLDEQFDGHESLDTPGDTPLTDESKILNDKIKIVVPQEMPDVISYKSNLDKLNFLQTQLAEDVETGSAFDDVKVCANVSYIKEENMPIVESKYENTNTDVNRTIDSSINLNEDVNLIADDSQVLNNSLLSKLDSEINPVTKMEEEPVAISVPPRRKKHLTTKKKESVVEQEKICPKINIHEYPDHLNPFSDDEDEELSKDEQKKASTNPFGSSDEEDDSVPPIPSAPKPIENKTTCRSKDQISTYNPFWSDGEPSSDEESHNESSNMYKCSMTTSTPNLPGSTPRRKKPRAPPPPVLKVTGAAPPPDPLAVSMDDVASISSVSSFNSTAHSDYKSLGKSTPMLKSRRPAPTPPDSLSTVSIAGSLEKGMDASENRHSTPDGGSRRTKGPAPGLPLPERREVKMQLSPEELQVQLDMLETQQLGLERQGVLIEQMIRQKCEGDEANTVPQEVVEDLVIQLCEIVNEKNDLFRKQTELMYIRRQQRLEQEQADIEHEIRILQSRPIVNRIDADKVREEQLVSRLVEIVRLRDELVQQLDSERRRERQEDLAIAASIASKRAQRNSDSTSSSMKSMEVQSTPKKNKMKDKVKKQLKKAKHTLIPKKKDDSTKPKEEKTEKKK